MNDEEENVDLNEDSENNLPEETESNNSSVSKRSRKSVQEELSKATTKNVAKKSLIKVLLPILIWVLVFIIILIIIIGIVVFFLTMPGMVMEKLKSMSLKLGNSLAAFFGGDTTEQIEDQEIYDVMDYLEQMGYDLKGYGFLTDTVGDSEDGVERTEEGKIKEAKSDFIFTYLASDNYVYTIANFNQTIDSNNGGFWATLLRGLKSLALKVGNIITAGQLGQHWGKGMLELHREGGDLGIVGAYYDPGFLSGDNIEIKVDESNNTKKLVIKRGWFGGPEEYNLDGWTGRYGMPIDFLLSIHLATMMPDLAYDMVESFDTKIVMILREVGGLFEENIYVPYIAYVKDHWYRDVYFVQNFEDKDKEFVTYDYEYESVMKERWTLYETYDDVNDPKYGEYKLYEINDDGTYKEENGKYKLFDGTAEEAEKEGIKVAKKAKTIKYEDEGQFEDIKWHKTDFGIWSAYEKLSEDEQGFIDQTGDGLRTETNPEIKKMFLNNTYFRYDGSSETADKIAELRKEISGDKPYYGPVKGIGPDGNEVDYTKETIVDKNNEIISVADVSGEVSLNQDSLNAFSMLENEHTLDADYIYRDFKELIVELGYFKKEELTDETPRLLEFIIPKICSNGYPIRSLDKRENEFGTMAHSKYDYKEFNATKYEEVEPVLDGIIEDDENDYLKNDDDQPENLTVVSSIRTDENNVSIASSQTINISQTVGGSSSKVTSDFDKAGWTETKAIVEKWVDKLNSTTIGNYYSKGNKKEYKEFLNQLGGIFARYAGDDVIGDGTGDALKDAGEYCYGLMNMLGFNYCAYDGTASYDLSRCSMFGKNFGASYLPLDAYPNYSAGAVPHHPHNGLPKKIDDCMLKQIFLTCCNYTTDKVYMKAGLVGGEGQPRNTTDIDSLLNEFGGQPVFEIGDLHLGDLIECYSSNGNNSTNPDDWSGWYHIMYVGEETDDTVTIYKTGHDYTNPANFRCEISKSASRDAMPAASGWVGIHVWDLQSTEKYEGYLGNEGVVSPVTGILLEYGTYEDEIDSISGAEYRENVDYKYDVKSILSTEETSDDSAISEEPVANENQEISENIPIDKVGYAKILVLDTENYLKLEKNTNNSWKNNSLLNENNVYLDKLKNEDEVSKWSDIDKTVYGYKEFAELYEKYGIAGYIVYIDGFKCSLPGDLKDGIVTNDEPITWDYFKDGRLSPSSLNLDNYKLKSLYEKDAKYKMASKKETDKLNAESLIKQKASPSLYFNTGEEELVFIKEGTIIGRTLTDKELLEDEQFRNKEFGTYEEIRENPDSERSIIGNYLRVIMRDLDGTEVENVEDYMKLDTPWDKGIRLCDDYDVTDESLFVTEEQFRTMFADKKNIIANTKAFMRMQEKYHVNAVFAACVTIIESGGGEKWAAINPSTHNWFSIKGQYNGHSQGVWKSYPSFAAAVDDFGRLMAYGKYYLRRKNTHVSQIGPIYCSQAWVKKVNKEMTFRYKKIL